MCRPCDVVLYISLLIHFWKPVKLSTSSRNVLSIQRKSLRNNPVLYLHYFHILIRETLRWVSQNLNTKKTMYIYFGLLDHLQELHETEKIQFFLGCALWRRWGKDRRKEVCQVFHFCDTHQEVLLISMNTYQLELWCTIVI